MSVPFDTGLFNKGVTVPVLFQRPKFLNHFVENVVMEWQRLGTRLSSPITLRMLGVVVWMSEIEGVKDTIRSHGGRDIVPPLTTLSGIRAARRTP